MYVTTVIFKMSRQRGDYSLEEPSQAHHMPHASMAELKSWVVFNHMLLGTPEVNTAYFSVEHTDGSPLSPEEMERLMEVASLEAWQERRRSAKFGPNANPRTGAMQSLTMQRLSRIVDELTREGSNKRGPRNPKK